MITCGQVCNLTTQWSECSTGPFPLPNASTLLRPWFELLSVGTAWVDQMQMTVAASSAGAHGTVSPALKHDDEATGTQIWFEDAMTKVFPDSLPVGAAPSSIRLDIARDEHAPFQVAIRPTQDLAHVSLRFITNHAAEEHGVPLSEDARKNVVKMGSQRRHNTGSSKT